jgi:predicted DNA-binding protein
LWSFDHLTPHLKQSPKAWHQEKIEEQESAYLANVVVEEVRPGEGSLTFLE